MARSAKSGPPQAAEKLLLKFLRSDLAEEVLGDLEEKFDAVAERKSVFRARLNYWYQVFNYLRPFAIRRSRSTSNHSVMIKHNLLLSVRHFKRHKTSFLINLTGLSTGLGCFFLIALWVAGELKTDQFLHNHEQVYRVASSSLGKETLLNTSSVVVDQIASEFPEVQSVVHSSWGMLESSLQIGTESFAVTGEFGSEDFFEVLSYPLIHGTAGKVLSAPNAIVISEETALKLFKTTDVVGKTLEWRWYTQSEPVQITGVYANLPASSSARFDYVLSFEVFEKYFQQRIEAGHYNARSYLQLAAGADPDVLNTKLLAFMEANYPNSTWKPFLIPYASYYLYNNYEDGKPVGGRMVYVKLFAAIAIFILLIAMVNFMNLSTARASLRTREIGVKKVFGAHRSHLVYQYLTESLLLSLVAGVIAGCLVWLLLPQFAQLTGKMPVLEPSLSGVMLVFGILFLTGILAGSYPALYLSSFRPIAVLKGKLTSTFGEKWIRNGLVVFQYGISFLLIVAVMVIRSQMQYIETKDLGYNQAQVITIGTQGLDPEKRQTFVNELRRINGVEGASSLTHSLVGGQATTGDVAWEGMNPDTQVWFEHGTVDYGLIELLGIEMVAGRSFSRDYGDESRRVIVNETAVKAMAMSEPVGKKLVIGDTDYQIAGVMKDFHFQSLHENIKPVFFRLTDRWALKIAVKLDPLRERETLGEIQSLHASFQTGFPFDYTFLEQFNQHKYASEAKVAALSKYFALVAIVISCLGLYGLAAFSAERRTREIGIRKVLGAGVGNIFRLLSGSFVRLIGIAVAVTLPLCYWACSEWLNSFTYSVKLQWWVFAAAAVLLTLVAMLTVSMQTVRAAKTNPIKCLRDE